MVWDACKGAQLIGRLTGAPGWKSGASATLGYVDTLDEQALLEEMLEHTKPVYKEDLGC